MAQRNIRYFGDEILKKKTRVVTDFDQKLWQLLDDMKETLEVLMGAGLAAPQVGILKKIAIVMIDDIYYEIINPEIITKEGEISDIEGCLSYPNKCGYVKRPQKIKVKAQNRNGKWYEIDAHDFIARALCHEIDHLNGILYSDMVEKWVDDEELEKINKEKVADEKQNSLKKKSYAKAGEQK